MFRLGIGTSGHQQLSHLGICGYCACAFLSVWLPYAKVVAARIWLDAIFSTLEGTQLHQGEGIDMDN